MIDRISPRDDIGFMPKFTVEHQTSQAPDQAFKTVKDVMAGDQSVLKKYDANAQFTFNDAQRTCDVKGGQFKAQMTVVPTGSGSKVSVMVDLPLLLTPFKGKVQESLQRMLAKHLA